MIHKIKSLYDDGNGMGFKAIARELGISKNTVKKYLKASVVEIVEDREDLSRAKVLDHFRPYLASQLETSPKLSAVKLRRKLEKKVGPLNLSDRSFRRYVGQLKAVVATAQFRYYEPVIDTVPGAQIQVDPGELRGVMIGGKPRTVYFVVFVLSFSRYLFVAASLKPIDTHLFIEMHDQAFRFFGGVPEECVYDQTKLVLIEEQYGELRLNDRFYQFAAEANFSVRACKPADPESKGKVESGVKYVKNDGLYGDAFGSEIDLHQHLRVWLDTVANCRDHGTTQRRPVDAWKEEKEHLKPYHLPNTSTVLQATAAETRNVDKTGLISVRGNKYSVPMKWQRSTVGVEVAGGKLLIFAPSTGEWLAEHTLSAERGKVIKNNHHYRDLDVRISELEQQLTAQLEGDQGVRLAALLKASLPDQYRDQLVGAAKVLRAAGAIPNDWMDDILDRSHLTVLRLQEHIEARQIGFRNGRDTGADTAPLADHERLENQSLVQYGHLTKGDHRGNA